MSDLLWDDERIHNALIDHMVEMKINNEYHWLTKSELAEDLILAMRDEMQERIQALQQELASATPSDEVAETLRLALTELRDSEENNRSPVKEIVDGHGYYELLHPELLEDVDAALAWLGDVKETTHE